MSSAPIQARTTAALVSICATALAATPAQADAHRGLPGPIAIDEQYGDWTPADLIAADPAGDSNTGLFDLTNVWARGSGSTLFLSFEFASPPRNLQSGFSSDGSPRVLITGPDGRAMALFHRNRQMFELDAAGDPVRFIDWHEPDFALLPSVASTRYETRIDLAPIGVGPGDTVSIGFGIDPWLGPVTNTHEAQYRTYTFAENPDDLDAPVGLTMGPAAPPTPAFDAGRAPGTDLRLASMNMLAGRLLNPAFAGETSRILTAIAADIYCLQEQNGSPSQIEAVFNSIDPDGTGNAWTAVTDPQTSQFSSDFIVTHLPVSQLTGPGVPDHFAAAVVGDTPGDAMLVLSVHFKCCGFIGDNDDDPIRIQQAQDVAAFIDQFRAEGFGPQFAPFASAPVAVLGDWNLVGSDEPRRLLTTPDGTPSLDHVTLLSTDGRDAVTWRDPDSDPGNFAPGLLDLAAISPQTLAVKGGFVLDTARLDTPTLTALGLQSTDSLFSDHLALVLDTAIRNNPADFNDDGVLDLTDIVGFIGAFTNGTSQADLAGPDGTRDLADISAFIEAFIGP